MTPDVTARLRVFGLTVSPRKSQARRQAKRLRDGQKVYELEGPPQLFCESLGHNWKYRDPGIPWNPIGNIGIQFLGNFEVFLRLIRA